MFKKFIAVISMLGFLLGFAFTAHAETVVTTNTATVNASSDIASLEAQVQMLIKQVAELRAKLAETQKFNAGLKEEVIAMRAELRLMSTLKQGDNNSDVTLLQEILATDPAIYPEGKVTGYFGPLTVAAVRRFQAKAGLEKVGQVGPKTMEKLNMIIKDGAGESGVVPEKLLKEYGTYALVKLAPLGDSGMYAHAKLHAEGTGKTRVVVEAMSKQINSVATDRVDAYGKPIMMQTTSMVSLLGTVHPAHIHTGTCPASGAVVYPLNPVVDGHSETVLEVGIEAVLKGMPLSLNMHKSAEDLTATACGNVEIPSLVWKEAPIGAITPPKTDSVTPYAPAVKPTVSTQSDVHVVTLAAGDFKFSTSEIVVKKGQRVKVMLKVGDGLHDFVVNEFSAHTAQVGAGEITYTEFTPDKTGVFEFYCSVGNHRAMGMVGKLVVVE